MKTQHRAICAIAALAIAVPLVGAAPSGAGNHPGSPGAPGVGDPYFPLDGNGGYDTRHYDLELGYSPTTGVLKGRATIEARSTQRLSSFNLDLVGLNVRHIRVDGDRADWSRDGQELVVEPRHSLRKGEKFKVKVWYDGVPEPVPEGGGFIPTDDGFIIAGEPHGAAYWFPANDHPTDAASYTFRVTVPKRLEVVANGDLVDKDRHGRWATWTWKAVDPMASYLATVNVGEFDLDFYRDGKIRYADAIDSDLLEPLGVPTDGTQLAIAQRADSSYQRLQHVIDVPAGGATVEFSIARGTETNWDFAFVEAHTVGQDDWTTLEDLNGHTSQDPGFSCNTWPFLHPFISTHYQTVDEATGECSPEGATGEWWAASGRSDGSERWEVDLGGFAGSTVELSIAYVTDEIFNFDGVFVDDVEVSTGQGTTSFEDGLGTWTVPGAPAGSPGNVLDWIVGGTEDAPPSTGDIISGSFARQPEIIDFLSDVFGHYPWRSAGGIVDDEPIGFALETQTRPVYDYVFFSDSVNGDAVVVHELAHQWYGDSVRVKRWQHIWLNEGFATYAEWLWAEHEGLDTPQAIADFFYNAIPEDDPFWQLTIGDPGPEGLFDFAVYARGAMTLQALRVAVGDADFFRILKVWAAWRAGRTTTTEKFIALAERISGEQLDELFETWLFTPGRPAEPPSPGPAARGIRPAPESAPDLLAQLRKESLRR